MLLVKAIAGDLSTLSNKLEGIQHYTTQTLIINLSLLEMYISAIVEQDNLTNIQYTSIVFEMAVGDR